MRSDPILVFSQLWTKRHIAKAKKRKEAAHDTSCALPKERRRFPRLRAAPRLSSDSPGRDTNVTVDLTRSPPAAMAECHAVVDVTALRRAGRASLSSRCSPPPGLPPHVVAPPAAALSEASHNAKLERARTHAHVHSAHQTSTPPDAPPAGDVSRQLGPTTLTHDEPMQGGTGQARQQVAVAAVADGGPGLKCDPFDELFAKKACAADHAYRSQP